MVEDGGGGDGSWFMERVEMEFSSLHVIRAASQILPSRAFLHLSVGDMLFSIFPKSC